jgi:outer membrane protein assembly factor BamB
MTEPSGWWMFHGDPAHSGYVTGSAINKALLQKPNGFGILHSLNIGGPVLSVPAVCNGFIYVGLANSREAIGAFGGQLLKIDLATGATVANYSWEILPNERDAHGFCGMGSTPTVVGGFVYFVAFNAKLYCLNESDLSEAWVTDLRNRDLSKNQPIQNYDPTQADVGNNPPAAGWSAPLVVGDRIYLGIGEGENEAVFSFVFCIDAASGNVVWVTCTNFYDNPAPNLIPQSTAPANLSSPFKAAPDPELRGASVWGCIAYDATLNRLYCPTGNGNPDGQLPTEGWTNGLLALDAGTGEFKAFFQAPPWSNYRVTDNDVDMGGSPTLLTREDGKRLVGVGCKNGTYFLLDADTLALEAHRQMLPTYLNGDLIPTVDAHVPGDTENFSGTYSTAAVDPVTGTIFMGVGGNNYHTVGPGIDYQTTPFMRAMDYQLNDAWPLDQGNPRLYQNVQTATMSDGTQILGMYQQQADSGVASPVVVNDVVFMSTTGVSLFAFEVADGTLLWKDQLGAQTGGMSGGYGYCLGPAVCGDYVVAGGLITGGDGGILRIYGPLPPSNTGGQT